MKALFAAAAGLVLLSGCLCREGNAYNVGAYPHQWSLEGPDYKHKVFGPMYFGEVKDFVREKESDGWYVWGYEEASLREDVMVNSVELDRPSPVKRSPWAFDIPRSMDDGVDAPRKESIPPYVDEGVQPHRQKYLVIMRRWQ